MEEVLRSVRLNPSGDICNHKCPMCDITSLGERVLLQEERQRLRAHQYVDFIEGLPPSVNFVEIVGGGEPLLLKDIDVLFETIKKKPICGRLITNGSLLTDALIETFIRTQWDEVRVSLDAASREVYLKTHGIDQFDLVIENIRKLVAARRGHRLPRVGIHFVIQRDNQHEIGDVVELGNELGVDATFDTLIQNEPSAELQLDDEQIAEVARSLERARERVNVPLAFGVESIDRSFNALVQSGMLSRGLRNRLMLFAAKRLGREAPGHSECRDSIDWNLSLLTESDRAGSRADYVEGRFCPVVQDQLEVRSNGMVIPCCMAQSMASSDVMITRGSVGEIWDAWGPFRKDLRKGKFHSFCVDKCNYQLPELD